MVWGTLQSDAGANLETVRIGVEKFLKITIFKHQFEIDLFLVTAFGFANGVGEIFALKIVRKMTFAKSQF